MREDKIHTLLDYFSKSPAPADLTWSLFVSAVENFKWESLLRPFPPMYITSDGEKQIIELKNDAAKITSIIEIKKQLEENSVNDTVLDLLYWVLIQSPSFSFKIVPRQNFKDVLNKVEGFKDSNALPHFIFEVDHSKKQRNRKFEELAEKFGSMYAFHGSMLPHYYSILYHGLQVNLNKVAAFGPGVYLSTQLDVSFNYSPAGFGWKDSEMGPTLSIVALCQMIDHPDVKFQDEKMTSRKFTSGGGGSQVPHYYFVVQNSDMVRVDYLLVYATQLPSTMMATIKERQKIRRKIVMICFLAYLVMMSLIAIYNSTYFNKVKLTVNNWWNPHEVLYGNG